ncbi:MAG: murein biosynthesis integral membrane protein MurJ [Turicibacter sp.]|nr:murein biosynthesis integral membrane protein MurJ [Turicibacter sp.]
MISKIGIVIVIAAIGKIMGVLRDRMQAVHFGTYGAEALAFSQASLLPRLFLDIMFASILSASFIPIFNRYLENKGREAALDLAASFVKLALILTTAFTVVAIILAAPIYTMLLSGEALPPETELLGIRLLRIMFPLLIISGLAFTFTGILQSLGKFYIPAAMSIASNGVILLYYFLFIERFGVYGLALAFILGWSTQVLIQIPFLVKIKFFGHLSKKNTYLREEFAGIGRLTLPAMVASWLGPINFWVNTRATINLYDGDHGFVALNMAYSLYTVITGLFVLSVSNILFPALSKMAARKDWSEYTELLQNSLRGLLFFLIPMTFGVMAVSEPLVSFVFQGGLFQETSVEITAIALFFFSPGIVGFGTQVILIRACFSIQDGKAPLYTSLLAMAINLILSFALAPHMEIGGPALASSIAITVAALCLFLRLRIRISKNLWNLSMSIDTAKMLLLAIIMYFAVTYSLNFFDNRLWALVVPIIGGLTLYILGTFALKIPESKIILNFLTKLFRPA